MSVRPQRLIALAAALALFAVHPAAAQEAPAAYRTPPAPIARILDAPPTPALSLSPDRTHAALVERAPLPPIADLAAPDVRLAGFRLNPRNGGPADSRTAWMTGLSIQPVAGGPARPVRLPDGARFSAPSWSPDGRSLAFLMRGETGFQAWVVDVRTAQARPLSGPTVNAAFGTGVVWTPDSRALMLRVVPEGRGAAPEAPAVPPGPRIELAGGRAAPVRTFQDLLQTDHDEALFVHHFTSRLAVAPVDGGPVRLVGEAGVISSYAPSPDGRFMLVTRLQRPFSRRVPASGFPTVVEVLDLDGAVVRRVADLPSTETLPAAFDAVREGPRAVQWRADADAVLVWAEAADGGDPRREAAVRDRLMALAAPFSGEPVVLAELPGRFAGVWWGRDDFALVRSRWWRTRAEHRFALDPGRPGAAREIGRRNYQDRYADPGDPLLRADGRGRGLLHFTPDGRGLFLAGDGATPEGDYPFLARLNLADGKSEVLWRSERTAYEVPVALLDPAGRTLLTRRETASEPPNFHVRPRGRGAARALTAFPDRAPEFTGVTKQLIEYARADGVKLSGTLYLPAGYDAKRDGPLPLLMWAYPTEFTDPEVAGQVRDAHNRFVRPGGSSHLFLLTQGYAVLDNPTMPVVGVDGAQPNDTFVEQLTASAQAAVDAVVALGVADRDRIAVGGHSYGAFMTANLLAHTDLFRTGIARSGAYNRTLTPFGFQAEERTYWQATETYTRMSPFTYAHQINEPILLIHGEADENSGTFPLQSERFFAALKGNGATARYVVLPHEGHGYRARESVMHALWEMVDWLDRHLKAAPPR